MVQSVMSVIKHKDLRLGPQHSSNIEKHHSMVLGRGRQGDLWTSLANSLAELVSNRFSEKLHLKICIGTD